MGFNLGFKGLKCLEAAASGPSRPIWSLVLCWFI